MDRAQEVMRTQDRMQGLVRALQSIVSDMDLPSLLQRIVDEARDLIGARYAALGVLGEGRTSLVQFVHTGLDTHTVEQIGSLPTGRGILGQLITDPHPLRLRDLAQHPSSSGFPENHPPMGSFLGVPVRISGQVFGNLYLTEKADGSEFTAEDEELAQSLAAAAAAAIDNARLFDVVSRREQWLQASRSITNALLGVLDREEALLLVARSVRSLAGADFAGVVVPDEDGDLVVAAADGVGSEDVAGQSVPVRGACGTAIEGRAAVVLEDLVAEGLMDGPIKALGMGPLAAVPLSTGDGVLGALAVGNLRGGAVFTPQDVELVGDFASQAALVLTVAANQASAKEAELAEERAKIARDLHDHAIQGIFAVGLGLNNMATRAGGEEAARLMEYVGRLDDAIKAIRNSIFTLQLRPSRTSSLRAQLSGIATESRTALGFTPLLRTDGPVDTLVRPEIAADLLAVLREALSNAARHAQATSVDVLVSAGSVVTLEVRDNGVGIGTPSRVSGLANMRARAEAHGGTCTVGDGPQSGTLVRWSVPLNPR